MPTHAHAAGRSLRYRFPLFAALIIVLTAGLAACTGADGVDAEAAEVPTTEPSAAPSATPTPAPPTSTPTPAATSTPAPTETPADPTWTPIPPAGGTPLRALADQRGFLIGAAARSGPIFENDLYAQRLAQEFNLLTVEWEMNFKPVHPEPDRYNFDQPDRVVAFAEANDMLVVGHTLVWHLEVPDWFAEGDYSREESIEVLREHIMTVVGRYKGRIYAWDVVNEAIDDDGSLRDSVWLERIGPEYIQMAFEFAHEADPDALLFYNDYGIEEPNEKSDAVYELLSDLKAEGVPVDGVGFQMHVGLDDRRDPDAVVENFERFGELGLTVHITEMDVSTSKVGGSVDEKLAAEADIYAEMLGACLEVDACGALVMWGFTDAHTYLDESEMPLPFDGDYQPKPAYDALAETLQEAD